MLVHSRHDGAQIISQLEKKKVFFAGKIPTIYLVLIMELKVELKLAWQNSLCKIVCQVIWWLWHEILTLCFPNQFNNKTCFSKFKWKDNCVAKRSNYHISDHITFLLSSVRKKIITAAKISQNVTAGYQDHDAITKEVGWSKSAVNYGFFPLLFSAQVCEVFIYWLIGQDISPGNFSFKPILKDFLRGKMQWPF